MDREKSGIHKYGDKSKKNRFDFDQFLGILLDIGRDWGFIIAVVFIIGAFIGVEPLNRPTMKTLFIVGGHSFRGAAGIIELYPYELFMGISLFCFALTAYPLLNNKWLYRAIVVFTIPVEMAIHLVLDKMYENELAPTLALSAIYGIGLILMVLYACLLDFINWIKAKIKKNQDSATDI